MSKLSFHRDTCRLCRSRDVELVTPLRPIPMATPNIALEAIGDTADALIRGTAPIDMYLCRECGHFQLLDVIDPEVMYLNFRYTTSISLGLPEHFRTMARDVLDWVGAAPGSSVLEVGSNDGTLLRAFQEQGMQVLGVDPAQKTAQAATASGVETLAAFFTAELGREIRRTRGPAPVVVCNNTLANIDEIDDLTDGIRAVLAPDGVFVFETSYGVDVARKALIDTVYHEHLSYFLVRPLDLFFARHGLELVEVEHIWTKGGSIRCYVQHQGGPRARRPSVDRMIAEEIAGGFDRPEPYQAFGRRVTEIREALHREIARVAPDGSAVAGYGASVGTVTLLHQFDLSHRLTALFDDNPLGDALSGPGYSIPILRSEEIYRLNPAATVILAWRYADPIIARHQRYLDGGGCFITPLPEVALRQAPGAL
jgi:SAM-dependent methyltransferase